MAEYQADVQVTIRPTLHIGTGEVCFERTGTGEYRRFRRNNPSQRWTNWPTSVKTWTLAEVLEQIAGWLDSPRVV